MHIFALIHLDAWPTLRHQKITDCFRDILTKLLYKASGISSAFTHFIKASESFGQLFGSELGKVAWVAWVVTCGLLSGSEILHAVRSYRFFRISL